MNELKESILNNDITLVVTTPTTRCLSIINMLNALSIQDNKKSLLFSFCVRSEYYSRRLLSYLSGIDYKLITKYSYPYVGISKNNKEKIDRDKYISAIEKIQDSNILMCSEKVFGNEDYVDYILDYSDIDFIFIDDFNYLMANTKYDLDEVFRKIKSKINTNVILWINKRGEKDENIIKKYNKYIKNFIVLDGCNYVDYKDIDMKIINDKTNMNFKLRVDKNNQVSESLFVK